MTVTLDDLRRAPNALAPHYTRFAVTERLLLSGHSHQAWPDVAEEGLLACLADAAAAVDGKWARAEQVAEEVRAGYRRLLHDPDGELALGPNTHDLVIKLLSALDLRQRPRVVTTDGEFHSLRRQLDRLAEACVELVRVPAEPVASLAERLAAEVDDRTAMVAVSAVLFTTARIVPALDALAGPCERHGAELLVDAYHALGPVPFPIHELGLSRAWVAGGGYKYLQLGEGNAVLRIPPHAYGVRPLVTGWFAEFDDLTAPHEPHVVTYGRPASRFASGTYDPASHYRGARVLRFFADHGLEPAFLRTVYQHQLGVLASAFDALDLPEARIARDRSHPVESLGGFLSFRAPEAGRLQQELVEGFGSPAHRAAYEECERFGFEHPRCRIGEGDGLTRIRIERIGLDVVVVEGVGDAALRAGAGHYPTTAHPCAAGNVGIAGHRTTYGQPFHHLDRLHAGDEIVLETPLTECRYVVSGQEVVGPRDVRVVAPTSDDRLTLTTCHPKGSSRQRLVVHALLIA